MNIVVVNDFAHVNGGAGQVALASALGLAERGHRVTVLCAVAPVAPWLAHPNLRVLCIGQQEIARDPARLRAVVQGLWNRRAAAAMRTLLQELPAGETLVHLHGWTKALSSSVIRAAASSGVPIVTTLHDYFSACPNGGFFNYRTQRICHLKPLSGACIGEHCDARSYGQKLYRVARQEVQRHAGKMPSALQHVIGVTDFSVAILKPYLPADAKVEVIPNPILGERQGAVDVAANAAFVCVGRLAPEKGGLLLAQAAQRAGAAVTFVGDGELKEAIQAACAHAEVTGWQDAAGVQAGLRRARALVLPSLWYETQGLVVGEAAALGVPAIVPDTCAAREAVIDGVTGLWFRGGDAIDLQDKIARLHADPALAQRLGQAAYARYWSAPPTLARHLDALEANYRRLLGAAGAPVPAAEAC